ncbi:hypothetical protein [Peredibacter starrii]|uniref:Uncharacterized protein n=1 Tax=Peredibacter starrii TaxID=28202 RepID=A0AAX4HQP6_9BACT|nr:hypothetical protein [Peredibacter starrii]WPU65676.1 hypothetical protein SOO65_02855 [Peredibacter starrii]
MNNAEIMGRFNHLKSNVQHLFSDMSHLVVDRIQRMKETDSVHPIHIDNYHYESHRIDVDYDLDDLPLTLNKDPGPGVRYNYTENSEFARGAPKAAAHGIDSFGEEDTFDPEEADEHQTYRDRKQNSDLDKRFYTH